MKRREEKGGWTGRVDKRGRGGKGGEKVKGEGLRKGKEKEDREEGIAYTAWGDRRPCTFLIVASMYHIIVISA